MKPRQRRAPLTVEDERIFCRLGTEVFFNGALSHLHFMHSMESDRRDADLMLQAQEIAQFGSAAIQLYGINFRGWDQDWSLMPGAIIE